MSNGSPSGSLRLHPSHVDAPDALKEVRAFVIAVTPVNCLYTAVPKLHKGIVPSEAAGAGAAAVPAFLPRRLLLFIRMKFG